MPPVAMDLAQEHVKVDAPEFVMAPAKEIVREDARAPVGVSAREVVAVIVVVIVVGVVSALAKLHAYIFAMALAWMDVRIILTNNT